MRAVFDTNILVDYLKGFSGAHRALAESAEPLISVITEIEILAGARTAEDERLVRALLREFAVVPLDHLVIPAAVRLRRTTRLKLPDGIVLATAVTQECPLVTRNTRDFPETDPMIRVPYRL